MIDFELYMRMTSAKIASWISLTTACLENVFRGLATTPQPICQLYLDINILLFNLYSITSSSGLLRYFHASGCCGTSMLNVQAAEMNEKEAIDNVIFRASLMTMANQKLFPVGKLIMLRK